MTGYSLIGIALLRSDARPADKSVLPDATTDAQLDRHTRVHAVATSGGVLAIYASYPVVAAAAIKGVIAATTPRDAFEQAVGYPAHRTLTMPMVPLGLLGGHDHCAPVCGDLAICGKCGWPQPHAISRHERA